ncbi:MAG: Gfo/Idh/MocA family oxidoreductase [Oscillospiraceae bacterium]|nr:Gfo/Idh/MocA family oxidoreductase [Oscillospiraceae bacterium]
MKIGIIGPGRIANTVAPALVNTDCIDCYAVASRDLAKAEAFAKKYGFQKVYNSYEAMLRDPEVELVYVATPHSHHYEHIMLCLEYGKAVICEKAFTLNADQAQKIREASEEKGIYVAEAIWTRYMPSRNMIQQTIDSGIIGEVNTLTANLSYDIDDKERIWNPNLAGGALLDIGVYGLNFATMHFGTDIERIESSVRMLDTGVDAMETITIFYKDGRMAVLTHSIFCRSDRKGIIHGDKGYIVVENINNPSSISVYDLDDKLVSFQEVPPQINGYEYEFIEAAQQIAKGEHESKSMPLDDSVYIMELMDGLRRQWGMVYPQEK